MTGMVTNQYSRGRSAYKATNRNINSRGARAPVSGSVRAVINHDYDTPCPMIEWDNVGSLVICDDRNYYVKGAYKPEDLELFCNGRFDVDRMLAEVWTTDPRAVGEYAKKYGALVSYVNGGFIIAGHDQIVKEYGYDNAQSRRMAQQAIDSEARTYMEWAEGNTYRWSLYDDHTDDESVPDEVIWDRYDDRTDDFGEYVDGMGGYIGDEDYVESEARQALIDYRRSQGREPNLVPSDSVRSRIEAMRAGSYGQGKSAPKKKEAKAPVKKTVAKKTASKSCKSKSSSKKSKGRR